MTLYDCDGMTLCAGLTGFAAWQTACRLATERGQAVTLVTDDGHEVTIEPGDDPAEAEGAAYEAREVRP